VRSRDPFGWAEDIAALAAASPPSLLAAAVDLPALDHLALLDRLTAHGFPMVAAVFIALGAVARLEDADAAAISEARWLDRLDAEPEVRRLQVAQRLERATPKAALSVWTRLGQRPGAALGRARCLVALGCVAEAMDELRHTDLDRLVPADALFAATLAVGAGDSGLAGAILDTIPPRPQGVPVEAVLQVAEIIGPESLARARRRFAASAA